MAISTETIRELQVLSQGRQVETASDAYLYAPNGPPVQDTDGVAFHAVDKVKPVYAFLGVRLTPKPTTQNATLTVDTVVVGDTYRATVDATNYDYVAQIGDTVSDVATGIVAAIGGATSGTVTPQDNADGTIDFIGDPDATYTLAASVVGTGTVTLAQDATSVSYTMWGYIPGVGWTNVPNTARTATNNESDRYYVAGYSRVHIEITATNGRVLPIYAPNTLETQ